jgi:CubicO group peptidase (beta-lactamase class C family)
MRRINGQPLALLVLAEHIFDACKKKVMVLKKKSMMKMKACLLFALMTCVYLGAALANDYDAPLDSILRDAIARHVTPGAAAIVGTGSEILYSRGIGHYTYGAVPPRNSENAAVDVNTFYDMASCSKILGATTALAIMHQRGQIDLGAKVSHYLGAEFDANGKQDVTVMNCLLHDAGFPPDPSPLYYSEQFACPETVATRDTRRPALTFSCQQQIYESLMNQTLQYATGTDYVYSDLSFITLMNVVGSVARQRALVGESELLPECVAASAAGANSTFQCYFEAYCRAVAWPAMGMRQIYFRPAEALWPRCAPAENSTDAYYLGTWQGQVSDENAYALGGIAGHAGVFSNAPELVTYARRWLFASDASQPINGTTAKLFRTDYNASLSSRALGFNTCNAAAKDQCWNFACGTLSGPDVFMHIGYTGTEICMSQERGLFTILLTNRVYPDATHSASSTHQLRYDFNTAVQKIFDRQSSL